MHRSDGRPSVRLTVCLVGQIVKVTHQGQHRRDQQKYRPQLLHRIWNSLPEDVSAAHLSLFISRLVRVNLNQFLIGKM